MKRKKKKKNYNHNHNNNPLLGFWDHTVGHGFTEQLAVQQESLVAGRVFPAAARIDSSHR
jgi:hypothetical protein